MIPLLCIQAMIDFLDFALGLVEALPIPNTVTEYLGIGITYIVTGMRFVAAYIDVPYIISLLSVVLAVDTGIYLYKCAMWIAKKIPFWSVN